MLKLVLSAHSRLLFSTSVKPTSPRWTPAPPPDCQLMEKPICSVKNLSASEIDPPVGIIGVMERNTEFITKDSPGYSASRFTTETRKIGFTFSDDSISKLC